MAAAAKLSINPIACEGHGMCAELMPELVELDEWGFPIVKKQEIPYSILEHAKRAERLCPTLAILIKLQ